MRVESGTAGAGEKRPNIVWILSEDNSYRFLRLFHPTGAAAPSIERLAEHGITFLQTFSNAPVCSVARSTLVTSCYAPRIAGQYHRKLQEASLPAVQRMFPACLADAGYYRTNRSKKDYNLVETPDLWDESSGQASWRNRPTPGTPFFHQQNIGVCHESCLHFPAEELHTKPTATDPGSVPIPGFSPDTPTFRYAYARYYDIMAEMDRQVGAIVQQLEDDGLLEDTFIFYFGDNGGILPGSKGYLWEDGLRVPLVVRVPENFKHLAPLTPGSRCGGFVSFVDFGATVLRLAGVPVPDDMDGLPFLGAGITAADVQGRDETVGYADRFDEKMDFCRSLRKGRYKYIRNYQCFYPDGLQNNYRYLMAAYREWRELHRAGELDEHLSRRFFEPKPVENLFDLESDPDELHDLAADPAHADVLLDMRARLREWVRQLPDLSFYPESVVVDQALADPIAFGAAHADEIARLVDIADLALLPFPEAAPELRAALGSANPWDRYWALVVCSCFGSAAVALADSARSCLDDAEPLVRVRAAEFLAVLGVEDPKAVLLEVLSSTQSAGEALITLNTVVYVNDHLDCDRIRAADIELRASHPQLDRRLLYLT